MKLHLSGSVDPVFLTLVQNHTSVQPHCISHVLNGPFIQTCLYMPVQGYHITFTDAWQQTTLLFTSMLGATACSVLVQEMHTPHEFAAGTRQACAGLKCILACPILRLAGLP